ncbi:MAG: hypothetical protein ACT4PE_05635 [Candidatus Eiseniibacteriota bacterium]
MTATLFALLRVWRELRRLHAIRVANGFRLSGDDVAHVINRELEGR